jgi:hypothetical protein
MFRHEWRETSSGRATRHDRVGQQARDRLTAGDDAARNSDLEPGRARPAQGLILGPFSAGRGCSSELASVILILVSVKAAPLANKAALLDRSRITESPENRQGATRSRCPATQPTVQVHLPEGAVPSRPARRRVHMRANQDLIWTGNNIALSRVTAVIKHLANIQPRARVRHQVVGPGPAGHGAGPARRPMTDLRQLGPARAPSPFTPSSPPTPSHSLIGTPPIPSNPPILPSNPGSAVKAYQSILSGPSPGSAREQSVALTTTTSARRMQRTRGGPAEARRAPRGRREARRGGPSGPPATPSPPRAAAAPRRAPAPWRAARGRGRG